MSWSFISSTARAAWAAATSKQAQLEGLRDEWAGQMSVRYYSSADAHLATVTHATPIIDTTTTPYSLRLGAYVAQTDYSVGVAAYCVLAVPAGADIARADCSLAGPGGAVTNPGGRVRTDIGTTLRVQATASLPAADTPAWRTAMASPDVLYYVSSAANAGSAGYAPALTGAPTHFGATASGGGAGTAGEDVMSGYSSGTLLADVGGGNGTMVFGTGGHTRLQNQMLGIDLNVDSPVYAWWHDPTYKTSETGGAQLYYSPSEQSALEAGARGSAAVIPSGEDASGWDRQFPVAFDGWIYPAKLTTGQMGDNVPHGFRFFSIAHVPASVTGGDSVMFAHIAAQGPFAQTWYPDTGSTMDEWADASALFTVGGNYRRRMPYYTRNLTTGAWSLHQWRPDIAPYTYGGLVSHTFPDLKRVYSLGVAVNAAGTTALGYWYVDMSSGIGSATESAWIIPTGDNEGTSFALGEYTCGAWTVGHPDDLHIFIGPDANFSDGLIVIDLDTDTIARIDLSAFSFSLPSNGDYIGMSYDATNNRVLILLKNTGTHALTYWSIGLPADPMVVTGYTAELRNVTTSEGSMPLSDIAYMYGKTKLHPTLGCILVPTNSGRMMGFVPSA